MAYTHSKYEWIAYGQASAGGVFTGTGDICWWAPITVPMRIRRIGVLISTALTVTSSIFSFDKQPTAGSASGRLVGAAFGGTMTITTALGVQGSGFVTPELNVEVLPGQRFVCNQTQASTAGAGMIILYLEPRWENVANIAALTVLSA